MAEQIDLTDFPFMPLYIARLQKSKAWLRCKRKPELAFYMLNLWLRAWHEIPAGTIENDDDVLADAAMCSPDKWEKLKDQVLQGWEVLENGRLAYSVVVEIAEQSWTEKQEYRRKKEEERARKAAKRAQGSAGSEPDNPDLSGGHPADNGGRDAGSPAEIALKGQGEGQGLEIIGGAPAFAETPAGLIQCFDFHSKKIFGESLSRAWPGSTDHVHAERFLKAGADIALMTGVFTSLLNRFKSEGQTAPTEIKIFEKWVNAAILEKNAPPKEAIHVNGTRKTASTLDDRLAKLDRLGREPANPMEPWPDIAGGRVIDQPVSGH